MFTVSCQMIYIKQCCVLCASKPPPSEDIVSFLLTTTTISFCLDRFCIVALCDLFRIEEANSGGDDDDDDDDDRHQLSMVCLSLH